MRVISGSARGTKLRTLSGTEVIRPTTDRVKESLFNIIQFSIVEAQVLDVFCGSGALGIEALSRGALHCDFVDSNAESLRCAEDNITSARLKAKATLHKCDYQAFFSRCTKKYDLIFADPPYAAGHLLSLLNAIEKSDALDRNGIFIFETALDTEGTDIEKFELYRTAVYGKTKILFYRHRES